MANNVKALWEDDELLSELQWELYNVIHKDKYGKVTMGATIGVLEFVKWNLLNEC